MSVLVAVPPALVLVLTSENPLPFDRSLRTTGGNFHGGLGLTMGIQSMFPVDFKAECQVDELARVNEQQSTYLHMGVNVWYTRIVGAV